MKPKGTRDEQTTRDRAILVGRLVTAGGAAGALGVSWLFANLAAAYFSGKPVIAADTTKAPPVPVAAIPVQKPPAVVQTVVHHPYGAAARAPAGSAPRPPAQGPAPAPPPPPAPVCHSTPSKPC